LTRNERWLLSEWRVADDRVRSRQESLLAHRERTPFGEIDLLCGDRATLKLIEVKSWRHELWGEGLVSMKQSRRLLQARAWCEERYRRPTELFLAVVGHDPETGWPTEPRYFEAGSGWLLTGY